MSDTVIAIERLGKRYRLTTSPSYALLRDAIVAGARALFGQRSAQPEIFWALREVSFSVARGEVVGIIGANGAGKSTLLKILARITPPTEGRAALRGRVGCLLEVGAGFHHELTGRENVFLSGAILGMSRAEIARKFDEIVAFAEVERFLDVPVKRYSSGMFIRLAFAVAAHLDTDVLLMDEAFSTGDAFFTERCLRRVRSAAEEGKTIILVSHNLRTIQQLCTRTLWLNRGAVAGDGATADILDMYLQSSPLMSSLKNDGTALAENEDFALLACVTEQGNTIKSSVENGAPTNLRFTYRIKRALKGFRLGFDLCASDNTVIFRSHHDANADHIAVTPPGTYQSTAILPANLLAPRHYFIVIRATIHNERYLIPEGALRFALSVRDTAATDRAYIGDPVAGLIVPMLTWTTTVDQRS
jgi:lipopolysaccharide transport system ATP-binding protein